MAPPLTPKQRATELDDRVAHEERAEVLRRAIQQALEDLRVLQSQVTGMLAKIDMTLRGN
jgi:hypothetical protein